MSYIGDFNTSAVIYSRFTTVTTTGAPTQLAGSPVLSVYKTNSTTQTTTGVSLGVDHDSVTGLNLITVDTSADGTFYAAGCDFQVIITTGTVGGTSVVGYVVAEFSIENRNIKADVRQFGGSNGTFSSGRPEVNTTHAAGTAWGSGAITSGAFAAGAINAAAVADGTIDRATFAADTGLQSIRSNTAQAGASGTITLDASASSTTDFYKDDEIYLTGGTGVGQYRMCTAYNGTSKVATVVPNWATNPDNTSTFAVLPKGATDIIAAAGTAWNSGAITSTTFANDAITSNAIGNNAITASKVAADVSAEISTQVMFDLQTATVGFIGTNGITSSSIATDAIGSAELAASAATEIATAVWDSLTSGLTTSGSAGKLLVDNLNATVGSRSSHSASDVWAVATRVLTAATNITSTGGTTVPQTGDSYARLGAPAGASVSADVAAVKMDTGNLVTRITSTLFSGITKLSEWLGAAFGKQTPDSTALTEIRATGAGSGTFSATTDSLEALRDRGDAAWITATGFSTLDAAGVRSAVGLASANLDTQLDALPTAAENADAVWDEARSGHSTTGSFGEYVFADTKLISGDATAADNAEAFFDGTGYAGTNNVIPTVTTVTNRVTANTDQLGGSAQSATDLKDFADTGYDPATHKIGTVVTTEQLTNNNDKTGYALTSAYDAAKTAASQTSVDALPTAAQNASATAAQVTTDHGSGSYVRNTEPLDAAGTRTALGLSSANLDTQLSTIDGVVDAILSDTGTDGVVVAAGSKTGYALTSGERDSIAAALLDLAAGVETNRTLRQALRLILASAAGKLSGAATSTVVIRDTNDSKDRISATVTADGDRTAVTYDAS